MSARRKGAAGPRRPQKGSERNRQRILAAAERLFAERGYSDSTIDAVAEVAAMQPLLSGRKVPEVKRSMERHKQLLLKSTRDLIQTMREEKPRLERAGNE